jgi:hypothetical protein
MIGAAASAMEITRIVLDVMSPAQNSIVDLAKKLEKIDGVLQIDINLSELEKNVEDFRVTLDGFGLNYEKIRDVIKDFGAVIRNIDNLTLRQYVHHTDNDALSASMLVLAKHADPKAERFDQIYHEFNDALTCIRSRRRERLSK